jgi:hypothetical protein
MSGAIEIVGVMLIRALTPTKPLYAHSRVEGELVYMVSLCFVAKSESRCPPPLQELCHGRSHSLQGTITAVHILKG